MFKKMFAALLAAAVFAGTAVHAEDVPVAVYPEGGLAQVVCLNDNGIMQADLGDSLDSATYRELCKRIGDAILNHTSADVYDLKIKLACSQDVINAYGDAYVTYPEGLALSNFSYGTYGGYVYNVCPQYLADGDTYTQYQNEMNARVEHYLNIAENVSDDDIIGKILVIHDAFADESKYATAELAAFDETTATAAEYVIYTAYGALVNKNAVCQGNTLALNMIYRELNERLKTKHGTDKDYIVTAICRSEEKNHIWNCLKIDGKWYHLDETWNDPVFVDENEKVLDVNYGALHDYFLATTEEMGKGMQKHGNPSLWEYASRDTDETITCTDGKFASGYIFNGGYQGVVSYASGKYNIDMRRYMINNTMGQYSNMQTQFTASTIKSNGLLLGDMYYHDDFKRNIAEYYVTDSITKPVNVFTAEYNGGAFAGMKSRGEFTAAGKGETGHIDLTNAKSGAKLFLWDWSGQKPLAETQIIK